MRTSSAAARAFSDSARSRAKKRRKTDGERFAPPPTLINALPKILGKVASFKARGGKRQIFLDFFEIFS